MTQPIRIFNWNVEIINPHERSGKFADVKALVDQQDADIICLTEAYPETLPDGGETITSGLSDWKHEAKGARKVMLWSRNGWQDVDMLGSATLPEGRFVSGRTQIQGVDLHIVGMCIPYRDYRNSAKYWGSRKKGRWQGAQEYMQALRREVLTQARYQSSTVLLGDFNLQIPPKTYPLPSEAINQTREATFSGWQIPTAGEIVDPALDKRFIDHIALSPDIRLLTRRFISRFDPQGQEELSDHNGVCLEISI